MVYVDDLSTVKRLVRLKKPKARNYQPEDIIGEIGELILGQKRGRENDDQITVFDATGMALLDIATAKLALKLAE